MSSQGISADRPAIRRVTVKFRRNLAVWAGLTGAPGLRDARAPRPSRCLIDMLWRTVGACHASRSPVMVRASWVLCAVAPHRSAASVRL